MRMIRARHAVVAILMLVLAGCKSGGTPGSSWWSANPFKSAPATPTNPYPPKPSQLYANSATSSPSSGISTGSLANSPSSATATGNRSLASSAPGNTRPGSTSTSVPSPGTVSAGSGFPGSTGSAGTGAASYPGTRASYTSPGMGTGSGPLESSGSTGGSRSVGSSTVTDAITSQRGYYSVSPSAAGPGSGPSGGSTSFGGSGSSQTSMPAHSPFSSPNGAPRFDTPSARYGNSGVKDPFGAPADRSNTSSAQSPQGFYPVTSGGPSQSGRAAATPYGSSTPNSSNGSGSSGWNYGSSTPASGVRRGSSTGAFDRPYAAPRSENDRGSRDPFGPPRSDDRPAPATYPLSGSEYRPGSTGYQPPASDYRPGETGYIPPSPGTRSSWPQPSSSNGSGSLGSNQPPRYPSTSASDGGIMPEDTPYRPGSVTEYQPRSSASPAGGSPASVSNPWATPSSYSTGNPTSGFSTGSGGMLR